MLTIISIIRKIISIPKFAAAAAIIGYQKCISPLLGARCRFVPSCSEYSKTAYLKHGLIKGTFLTVRRLAKCGPWHSGGVDEVPERCSIFGGKPR